MRRHIFIALIGTICTVAPALQGQEKFLGKSVDQWAGQLKHNDAVQRRSAAFALGKMGSRAFLVNEDMRNAFARERVATVREAIVYALGEIARDTSAANGNKDLEELFLKAIQEESPLVRRSAAFALGCLATQNEKVQAALKEALGDEHATVRQNAIWAVGQLRQPPMELLVKGLRDADSLVKRDAAGALLQVKDGDKVHEHLKEILPLCRDPNSETRRAALNVLVQIVDPTDKLAIPHLRWVLEDRDAEIRRNAALALSNIGGEESAVAMPVLLDAARNADPDMRRQAILAFRNLKAFAAPAVKDLIGYLQDDKDATVRKHAALALGGIGKASEPAIPLLTKTLQSRDTERDVRYECVMALAMIGDVPGARAAVPTLLEILGDKNHDPMIRERTVWALRVHEDELKNMKGPLQAFTTLLAEPVTNENRMLRYDCAYMLGMIWQKDAPPATLDVLAKFLEDNSIKLYQSTVSGVGGAGFESVGGTTKVQDRGAGDGRMMAVDALERMGPTRYASRPDIMKSLRSLAADAKAYPPLRKKAQELIKGVQ